MTSLKMAYMGRNTYEEHHILINIYGCMCSQFDWIPCNQSTAQNMDSFKNVWGSFLQTQNRTHQETRQGHNENQTLLVSTVDSLTHCYRKGDFRFLLRRNKTSTHFTAWFEIIGISNALCIWHILSVKDQVKCSRSYYYYLNSRFYVQKEVKHCNSTKSVNLI